MRFVARLHERLSGFGIIAIQECFKVFPVDVTIECKALRTASFPIAFSLSLIFLCVVFVIDNVLVEVGVPPFVDVEVLELVVFLPDPNFVLFMVWNEKVLI